MKATGIIRRIDDLGRVVIPKELRKKMKLQECDPLEFFMQGDNIILQKYQTQEDKEELLHKKRLDYCIKNYSNSIVSIIRSDEETHILFKNGHFVKIKRHTEDMEDLNTVIMYAIVIAFYKSDFALLDEEIE